MQALCPGMHACSRRNNAHSTSDARKANHTPALQALKAALPPAEPLVWRKPGSKPGGAKSRGCLAAVLPCLQP